MKTLLTTILILSSLAGFGQSGITLQDNKFISCGIYGTLKIDSTLNSNPYWISSNVKPIIDTVSVLIVFAEVPNKVSEVKYMMGYLVREQNGYYDAAYKTANINGFTTSIYTPRPLMINVKYLDGNKIDIPSNIHILMSKEIKP